MFNSRSLAPTFALLALLVPLHTDWSAGAQKTTKNEFQQQDISSGSNPENVYGDFREAFSLEDQQSNLLEVPVQQRRETFVSRQDTRTVQRPVYHRTQESSVRSSYVGSVDVQPQLDLPAYSSVPPTSFTCEGLPYEYGMYADEATGCRAYHVCYNGRKDSFMCGPGTLFNQRILHCDHPHAVECVRSSLYYSSNAYMGSSQPEPGPAQAAPVFNQQQTSSSSYRRTLASPANFGRAQSSLSVNRETQQQHQEDF